MTRHRPHDHCGGSESCYQWGFGKGFRDGVEVHPPVTMPSDTRPRPDDRTLALALEDLASVVGNQTGSDPTGVSRRVDEVLAWSYSVLNPPVDAPAAESRAASITALTRTPEEAAEYGRQHPNGEWWE